MKEREEVVVKKKDDLERVTVIFFCDKQENSEFFCSWVGN